MKKTEIEQIINKAIDDFNSKWTSHQERSLGVSDYAERIQAKAQTELLDYFAAKALQAVITNQEMWLAVIEDSRRFKRNQTDTVHDYVAQVCYDQAEAMLKESEHRKNNPK